MSSLILKWSTLIAILSAIVMALLGIISQFYPPIHTRIEWYMNILLLVFAAMLAYLYDRIESIENRSRLIVDRLGVESIKIFRNKEELFSKMLEVTEGSQEVCTQMFSDPPDDIGGQMVKYFKKVENHIKKNSKMIFRRIVTLGDSRKVKWIMKLLSEMIGLHNFSLAYINVDHKRTPLLCVHLVEKEGKLFTFIFHTVYASGNVYAFLIESSEVGRVVLDYFNGLWAISPKLMEGRQIHEDEIRKLAEQYGVENSQEYANLKEKLDKYKKETVKYS